MNINIKHVSLLVKDYDEAIAFYVNKLGFNLLENNDLGNGKRWVTVGPNNSDFSIVLNKVTKPEQLTYVGNQCAGKVLLILSTDDCIRDYERFKALGVEFIQTPTVLPHGTVAIFKDLYGNLFDLAQYNTL